MSVALVVSKLYPVVLALANIGIGVGLYVTGALFFSVLMWTTAALVLVGLVSSVAPRLIHRHDDTRELPGQPR